MAGKGKKKKTTDNSIAVNRKAWHDYEILNKYEAGVSLVGSEVKSIREGRVNLKDSYVEIREMEAFLMNTHISEYMNSSYNNHEPRRKRKLLLHKAEIMKLDRKIKVKGVTIVPLRMYFNPKGYIKMEIAVVKGKRLYEKKQTIKDRDVNREINRDLKNYR